MLCVYGPLPLPMTYTYRPLPLPMTSTYRHLPLPVFIILASTVINLLQPLQNYKQYLLHNVQKFYADLCCILLNHHIP